MSVLDDDIMHIDGATGRFAVTLVNLPIVKEILRLPGNDPQYTIEAYMPGWIDKVVDSIKAHLEAVPIMELTDRKVENICRGHVKSQKNCWFFGLGSSRQLNRDNKDHWELIYKRTRYTKPACIAVYPIYDVNIND